MRSSIRTITNVSLDNRTVDLTEEGLSYQINSDHISFITSEYTDIDSRTSFLRTLGDGIDTDYSRGQRISVSMSSGFTAGRDYMCVQTIYQRKAGDMTEEDTTGNFDVYMGAGRVQEDSTTATYVYIDKDIGFYRSPVWRSSKLVGGCILRLNDRDLLITAYNPTTGRATVEGVNIDGTTSTTRATVQGESYKLITNYLVCDAFVFFYRTAPTISVSCELTTNGIEAVGTYSQAQGTEIQSWRMWAAYNGDGLFMNKMTLYHETHFNTNMEDTFPLSASNGYDPYDPDYPSLVDIYLEVTTQDGVTAQTSERLSFSADYPLTVTLDYHNDIWIDGMPLGSRSFVYRNQAMDQGDDTPVMSGYKYMGSSSTIISTQGPSNRFTTPENGYQTTYEYIVCGIDEEGNIYYGKSNKFVNPVRQWSLEHIVKDGYNSYHRTSSVLDKVYFTVDVQPSQIETVVGATVYGTEGQFPKLVHGTDRYDTGSFTALLGSVNFPEAAAYRIDNWIRFISQDGLFLLKTDYGDVKVVAITGNPTRQYGSSLAEIGLTRVTYTYAEVADINEVVVR